MAASVVFVHHVLITIPAVANAGYAQHDAGAWNWFLYTPLHFVAAGTEAVVVFFVLSGFVLLLPIERASFRWLAYYPSRLIRLYLPVIAAVIWSYLVVILIPRGGLIHDPSEWLRAHASAPDPLSATGDAVLLFGTSEVDGPLWSLRWEVVFSLLLPLYAWVAVKLRRFWPVLLAAAILAPGVFATVGAPGLQYLPMFAVGLVIAVAREPIGVFCDRLNRSRFGQLAWGVILVLAICGITAAWTVGPQLPNRLSTLALCAVVLGAALWFLLAFGCPPAQRFLNLRPVQWIGRISFSFYLVHELVVIAVAQLLPARNGWLVFVISAPISLAVGWAFFVFVEGPAHRLSQQVRTAMSRRTGRSVAATAAK